MGGQQDDTTGAHEYFDGGLRLAFFFFVEVVCIEYKLAELETLWTNNVDVIVTKLRDVEMYDGCLEGLEG